MLTEGKKKVAGRTMSWRTSGQMTFVIWKLVIVACIDNREGIYHVILGTPKPWKEHVQCEDFEAALSWIEDYIKDGKDVILERIESLRKDNKEAINTYDYHVELEDLTPEHDLIHSDLINCRLKHILRCYEIYNLKQLSRLSRKEFLAFRNCGNMCAEDIEKLLSAVGLDWQMPKSPLESYSDRELIAECRRRGLTI